MEHYRVRSGHLYLEIPEGDPPMLTWVPIPSATEFTRNEAIVFALLCGLMGRTGAVPERIEK